MKTYKDLPSHEETELVLLLGFFEDSLQNAHIQMDRWKQLKSGWDLQMFFIAVMRIDEASEGLKHFVDHDDEEVWSILKEFRKKVEQHQIRELRNDIIHPRKISKLRDQKGKPLPENPILHLGTYHVDKDKYYFGKYRINLSKIFDLVNQMTQELRTLSSRRLTKFYQNRTGDVEGMISFPYLHHFPF